jgi:hypothetical protein
MTANEDWTRILKAMRPEGWERSGLYVLGCFDRRVTVLTQQARALNLVRALEEDGELAACTTVAVIGGGAAGLMAAAAAARRGRQVTVFEEADEVLHFQASSDRPLLPYIYRWPAPGSLEPRTDLPFFNWTAGPASDVARALIRELKGYEESRWLDVQRRTRIETAERLNGKLGSPRIRLHWSNGKRTRDFHLVILAIGFGREARMTGPAPNTPSYWAGDDIAIVHRDRRIPMAILDVTGALREGTREFFAAAPGDATRSRKLAANPANAQASIGPDDRCRRGALRPQCGAPWASAESWADPAIARAIEPVGRRIAGDATKL